MSVFVDDITFSCKKPIEQHFISFVNRTLKKFGYRVSVNKCKYNVPGKVKKITGVIIDKDGEIKVSNHIKYQIHKGLEAIKKKNRDDFNKLNGYLYCISRNQI